VVTVCATAIEAAKAIAERVAIANILNRPNLLISVFLTPKFFLVVNSRGASRGIRHPHHAHGYRLIFEDKTLVTKATPAVSEWVERKLLFADRKAID
jgi:hypothetical protein